MAPDGAPTSTSSRLVPPTLPNLLRHHHPPNQVTPPHSPRSRRSSGRRAIRRHSAASSHGVPPAEEVRHLRGARRRPGQEQQVHPRGQEDLVPDGAGEPFDLGGGQLEVEEGTAALQVPEQGGFGRVSEKLCSFSVPLMFS
jgi:hypothetical protein